MSDAGAVAGGLASGLLDALADDHALWFGSGDRNAERCDIRVTALGNVRMMAMSFPAEDYARFYNGFCNSVLWPACHGMQERIRRTPGDYRAYLNTNREFANTMHRYLLARDIVWVHDYHLLPLGRYLRKRGVANRLGFFFHVPVPDPGVLKQVDCPDVFAALRAYDCIGVQTAGDAARLSRFPMDARSRIIVAPVSIDVDKFQSVAQTATDAVSDTAVWGKRLLVGVDRLDYTKGLIARLEGIDILLRDYAQYRGTVTFLQVLAPCRAGAAGYAELEAKIRRLVDDVNSRWGTSAWQPIHLHQGAVPREQVAALLRAAAVGVVTPLCDGMNLVAKEFIAAQDADDPGVLILSRQAGAARELTGAQPVDAGNPTEIAVAIDRSLRTTLTQRRRDHKKLLASLREHCAAHWARRLRSGLNDPQEVRAAERKMPVAGGAAHWSRSGAWRVVG